MRTQLSKIKQASREMGPVRLLAGATRRSIGAARSLRERDTPRRSQPPLPTAPYHLVSPDPVILYSKDWAFRQASPPILQILDAMQDRPVHLYFAPSWDTGPRRMPALVNLLKGLVSRFPRLSIVVTAPTELGRSEYSAAGLDAMYFNQNALVDLAAFSVQDVSKSYDAVYTARLARFKRFELARDVASLAVICESANEVLATPYGKRARRWLSHADWVSDGRDGSRKIEPAEVGAILNRARVGLALSAEEGPMYSSIEYLLCGIPVVTTPNHGGRNEFLGPAVALTVEANPSAVAGGVQRVIGAELDPHAVRATTLDAITEHRVRLIESVQAIFDRSGARRDFAGEWDSVYTPKLYPIEGIGRAAVEAHNRTILDQLQRR